MYCDSFPEEDGRYKLTQWFDSTDLLSCEFCDKQGGVCKQARDAAGDLVKRRGESQNPEAFKWVSEPRSFSRPPCFRARPPCAHL